MTTEDQTKRSANLPFLFHFKESIPESVHHSLRYDAQRQVSQALVQGRWIDSVDALSPLPGLTRETRVPRETTDDA